ncbi:MAG: glycoside hydrolase family 127 protein [Bacteroidales bacterium]|nr:glycoside hydrolase family 127 protein [Bacteroidales bacterium]
MLSKLTILVIFSLMVGCSPDQKLTNDYPIQPVSFTDVKITKGFWLKWEEINQKVTIPYEFKKCEETGRISNFAKAGGLEEGKFEGIYFNDSDVFKVIEGAAYSLQVHPDNELETYLDTLIAKITAAQEPDGYLYTNRTINPEKAADGAGTERWTNLKDYHELYNVGHMYEAAVAYYQATGKRSLLDVAIKNADLVSATFGPGKNTDVPGHEEIEIGLVKLYRITGDIKYLNLAKFFIDQRGNADGHKLYGVYYQDHKPVIEQDEAVGHSVRAGYLYSGMADIAALTGDEKYIKALDKIWENVITKKLYLTGGIGSSRKGEAFGEGYDLLNATAYTETCAAIANMLWNHRMFLLKGESKYMDIFERVLYNGFLAGISLEGNTFFYPNPLEFDGKYKFNQGATCRSPWFNCSCCPVNIVRTLPSIPGYVYAINDNDLYINLFINSESTLNINENKFSLTQETNYPWEGKIKISVSTDHKFPASFHLRIPGWTDNQPVPGNLYRYAEKLKNRPTLLVNGRELDYPKEKGYLVVSRNWKDGDIIELNIPMPVRKVLGNDRLLDDKNKIALERGPIVYAAEAIDNGGRVLNLQLDKSQKFKNEFKPKLLNGVSIVTGKSKLIDVTPTQINEVGEQDFMAIPYFAWANREIGEMAVWLPYNKKPFKIKPNLAFKRKVKIEYKASDKFGSPSQLTDGYQAEPEDLLSWTGFEGTDMVAIIDLGGTYPIKEVSVGFLQITDLWIFMPLELEVSVWDPDSGYGKPVILENTVPEDKPGEFRKDFSVKLHGVRTSHLKITAKNRKECPDWHPGAGGKAWVFADEIIIE